MKSRLYGKLEMLDGLFSSIKNSRHADASEIKMKGTDIKIKTFLDSKD